MRLARKASISSMELTWARSGMAGQISSLVEVFLDTLGFAHQVGRVLVGYLDEFFERLHRLLEFLGEFGVLLVLPGVGQSREARLQRSQPVLQFGIEAFELVGEATHLLGVHY